MLSRNSLILSALAFCTLPLVEYSNAGCPGGVCPKKTGQKAGKQPKKQKRCKNGVCRK